MVITRIESVPQLWEEERDGAFFRLVNGLFSADFLYGASVLLAGTDLDAGPESSASTCAGRSALRSGTRPAKASA